MKKLIFGLLVALALVSVPLAQTNPAVSTTLSVAVNSSQNVITLASATGIADNYGLYVNAEYMTVNPSWTSGTQIPVMRGQLGTTAKAHPVSATVIVGPPGMFSTTDPGGGSSTCPSAPAQYLIQVNTVTGNVWLCRYIGADRIWTATNQRLLTYNSLTIG